MSEKNANAPTRKRKRMRGSGGIYKRGKKWLIKWREGGRQRYKTFTDEQLARRTLAKIMNDVEATGVGLAPESPLTLDQLATDFLERRKGTHRAAKQDRSRWKVHLKPFFGGYKPNGVGPAEIRSFVEHKRTAGLNPSTIGHCVRLLSIFYVDLVERKLTKVNPVRSLPRSTKRLYKPTTDPRKTPFLESLDDVRAVYQALPEPISVAFAIGAFGGLRTGEVLGLDWRDVDLVGRRLYVRQQVNNNKLAPLKDDDSRTVPIMASLIPILRSWKLRTGGDGLLFGPTHPARGGRPGAPSMFMRPSTLRRHLGEALDELEMPRLSWYQCTRHTFASLWVQWSGSIEKLATIMGHSSIVVTERYAHLRPDLFRDADYHVLDVDLSARKKVVQLHPGAAATDENGCSLVTDAVEAKTAGAVGRRKN
jgi:integrase